MSNSQTFLSLLLMDLIESCLKRIYCNHILVIFFVTHLLLLVMMAMLYYYSGEKRAGRGERASGSGNAATAHAHTKSSGV